MSLGLHKASLLPPESLKNRSGKETEVCDSTLVLP